MKIAGIDYSMSCPSITVGSCKDFSKCHSFFYYVKKKYEGIHNGNILGTMIKPYESAIERYENIALWALAILKAAKVTHVILEGFSMGSKGQVFNIAENTGILKYVLYKNGIEVITPSPSQIKKYFTGLGNAKKDKMYETFLKQTGVDVATIMSANLATNPVSDIVDSYAMMCYGLDNL